MCQYGVAVRATACGSTRSSKPVIALRLGDKRGEPFLWHATAVNPTQCLPEQCTRKNSFSYHAIRKPPQCPTGGVRTQLGDTVHHTAKLYAKGFLGLVNI